MNGALLDEDFRHQLCAGVVTGIPMEFQFGTIGRSSRALRRRHRPALAWKALFLSSGVGILGLFLYGEKRLGKWGHWGAGFLVFLGSWISGFFIIVADAWIAASSGLQRLSNGGFSVSSFWGLLTNRGR